MKEPFPDQFETFLKRFEPSAPRDELMQRLGNALREADSQPPLESPIPMHAAYIPRLALAACAALLATVAGVWWYASSSGQNLQANSLKEPFPPAASVANPVPQEFHLAPAPDIQAVDMGLAQDENGQTYRLIRWEWTQQSTLRDDTSNRTIQLHEPRSLVMPVKLQQP